MADTADRVTRFAADPVDSAAAEGARQSRSAKQQHADEIAKRRRPNDPATHSYEATRIAAETMFSHPSKLELVDNAHAAGYSVIGGIL